MKKILFSVAIVFALQTAKAQIAKLPLSQQVAATVMQNWKDSFALDGKPAKWSYDMGVILKGFEGIWMNTGDAKYYQYIQQQMDYFLNNDGSIKTYKKDDYNIDNVNNGKLLLLLYRVTLKDKYLKAATLLREQLRNQPRTNSGGFWHKKIYPNQMWLDGLYMGEPFYAEWAWLSHEDSAFNDIARQFTEIYNHTKDPQTGLLYHAWDESKMMKWANPKTGCSPFFWSRAMGWYLTALVDVLDYFPASHPQRPALLKILKDVLTAVKKEQDPVTGLWKDILHYSGPGKEKNYFETSASCQFVYAIAKSVRLDYLPETFAETAKKGYAGIVKKFIKTENGQTNLYGTVKVSGLGGNPYRDGSFEYYMSEPVIVNDPKGIGAFLLMSNEMEMRPTLGYGKGKTIVMDNYFNRETKLDSFGRKIVFHYKWWEKDNGGFSTMAHVIHKYGMKTESLDDAPTAANLKNAAAYFLIDPDWPKENKTPNYIEPAHIEAIYNYVKNGGILIMMANDSNNVEFKHYNELAERFGIHWNENMRQDVIDNQFEQGQVVFLPYHPVFRTGNLAYIKQLCTQTLKAPAKSVYSSKYSPNGEYEVVMSVSKVGKGVVFAVGDPWFYNEYTDGRKLPAEYLNYKAAEDLIKWIINPKHPDTPYTTGPSKGIFNQ
ncbi:MAG: glycoside hydrolase family 88 protein [Chitinophagaceae bacterium]|nr:glycoside hydrolase family 88 protein [Chitinophagaceae bacterium]